MRVHAEEEHIVTDEVEERRRTTREVAEQYQALLVAQDWDRWIDLWSDDGTCEFPYAAEGSPERLEGRHAILEYMRAYPGRITIDGIDDVVMHETADGRRLIAEIAISGHATGTDRPYDQRYVVVFEVEHGKLVRYREYWNPLVLLEAFPDDADGPHASRRPEAFGPEGAVAPGRAGGA